MFNVSLDPSACVDCKTISRAGSQERVTWACIGMRVIVHRVLNLALVFEDVSAQVPNHHARCSNFRAKTIAFLQFFVHRVRKRCFFCL